MHSDTGANDELVPLLDALTSHVETGVSGGDFFISIIYIRKKREW